MGARDRTIRRANYQSQELHRYAYGYVSVYCEKVRTGTSESVARYYEERELQIRLGATGLGAPIKGSILGPLDGRYGLI